MMRAKLILTCLIVIAVFSLNGCFKGEQIPQKPKCKIDVNSPEFRAMIVCLYAIWQGQSWGEKEYLAEIENQRYLMGKR